MITIEREDSSLANARRTLGHHNPECAVLLCPHSTNKSADLLTHKHFRINLFCNSSRSKT